MDRRTFLRLGGASLALPATAALAACGDDGPATGSAAAAGAATTAAATPLRKVTLGFIALTDAASVIMAKELGYFAEMGLDVSVVKQASWPACRDALLTGQIDGAHCLFSMPLAVTTGEKPSRDLRIAMVLSQNGQAITLERSFAGIPYGDAKAAGEAIRRKPGASFGTTYPGGTHDIWFKYWLKAAGVDSATVSIKPVPPPQMVQNMTVNTIQGYCVGEPWNAVAVKNGIGFTHIATQDVWQDHPEKALVVNKRFAETKADVLVDVMVAILKASEHLDDLANRQKAAEVIGVERYVNAPPAEIAGRLAGRYELGGGLGSKDFAGDQMQFFQDGKVNLPRKSHLLWFMAQYARLGFVKAPIPDARALADELVLTDLYAKAAGKAGVAIPADDMQPFDVALDRATFDPTKLDEESKRP